MAEPPATRVTLLNRLKDGRDHQAWLEFIRLYSPVIYGFARKRGLQDSDAADLMQEVFRSVSRNMEKLEYDPKKGTFRGWLYTITRNKIFNFLTSQKNRPRASGDSGVQERLDNVADSDEADNDAEWELEYQRRISAEAMERVKPEFQANTWKAFWGTAVDGRSAQEVGAELKMSPGAVYVAKSRVLARLREEVQRVMAEEDEK
jgi:RNA polymerase sigma-70 factor (ECF subfamily)